MLCHLVDHYDRDVAADSSIRQEVTTQSYPVKIQHFELVLVIYVETIPLECVYSRMIKNIKGSDNDHLVFIARHKIGER
jgi:hypothetical protein